MNTPAIQHQLQLADEIRQLIAENTRLKNELKETEGFLFGMLITNGGRLRYRQADADIQLNNGLKNGIAQLLDKGLVYHETNVELYLYLNGLSIFDHGGPSSWENMKAAFPELFK